MHFYTIYIYIYIYIYIIIIAVILLLNGFDLTNRLRIESPVFSRTLIGTSHLSNTCWLYEITLWCCTNVKYAFVFPIGVPSFLLVQLFSCNFLHFREFIFAWVDLGVFTFFVEDFLRFIIHTYSFLFSISRKLHFVHVELDVSLSFFIFNL